MNSRQNIYCNDRRYSYGVATVAVSELISDTATARPKQQGWARDRDVSISRQSRDLSMVSSRCSARTSRPRLDLDLPGLEPKTDFYSNFFEMVLST